MSIDKDMNLEVRTYGPLVKDPDLSVLVDLLLQSGANIAEWTDEEAERCRLAAFFPETALVSRDGGVRQWIRPAHGDRGAHVVSWERFVGSFDLDDRAVEALTAVTLWPPARGARLPLWCSASSEGVYGEVRDVLLWPELVRLARERLAAQRAERSKRKARKAARAEARP